MDIRKYKRRGYNAEREFNKELRNKHIWSWRIPSSGYRTGKFALPDVIGILHGKIMGFEVKTTEKDEFSHSLKDTDPIIVWLRNSLSFPVEARGFLVAKFIGNNRWKGQEIFQLEEGKERIFTFKRKGAVKITHLLRQLHITVDSLI